ncbi:MAG TPA: AgmX/PglI C-terminal domain-containing protein [Polyangia bacterium]|nr:AgmX/PglI C-terminal domain-containing protein [Polyangia bacterium]
MGGGGAGSPPGPAAAAAGRPTGSLDKEVIRGVIRSHIGDVQRCYELQLGDRPDLFGRVMVQFTIAVSGQVSESALQDTTMHDGQVESCTVAAVRRWRFPPPEGGGIVIVSYPFVFTPADPIPLSFTPAAGDGPVDIKVLELDTMVHRSTNAQGIPSNGLIVVTDRGLILIDTAWTETQTEAISRWGEARFARPWIGAVITHDHPDRDGGVGVLLRRRIPVAALDLTVAKLRRRLRRVLDQADGGEGSRLRWRRESGTLA